MTKYNRVVRIDHKADDLFELVSDIDNYPKFIRWIQRMDVETLSSEGARTSRIGTAKVGFKGFSETMSTRVDTNSDDRTIHVSLVKGPLKHLENSWTFKPKGDRTDIEFSVDFEFRNFLLRALAAANFEIAVNRIMAAFIAEADRRYGKKQGRGEKA